MVSNEEKTKAMEEGKAAVAANGSKKTVAHNNKTAVLRGAVGVALLVTAILVVALPLSLNKRSSSKLSSDLTRGDGSLPALSLGTLKETYSSCTELESDLKTAARMIAEQRIESNVETYFRGPGMERFAGGRPTGLWSAATSVAIATTARNQPVTEVAATSSLSAGTAGGAADIATDESSFESNVRSVVFCRSVLLSI